MQGLIESATAILSGSERRLETVSNNVANVATPGFKRQMSFSEVLSRGAVGGAQFLPGLADMPSDHASDALPDVRARSDLTPGKLSATKNPLDLAISGEGFFQLRAADRVVYSRQGQFSLAADGTVVTPQGHALQQAGGGDLVLDRAEVRILADGTVLDGDRSVGRIGVYAAANDLAAGDLQATAGVQANGGSFFSIPGEAVEIAAPALRQGMVEASNVSMADEMVTMMAAVRQAEGGARLVQLYDELMGRAITAFGQQ